MTKYQRFSKGDLVSYAYEGSRGQFQRDRAVAVSSTELKNGAVINRNQETVTQHGKTFELHMTKVVVPASQVRYPGVKAGDTVKLRTGDTAYRVTAVKDGIVHLEDGRSVPVTEVAAFDEDVHDYDPFSIPGDFKRGL